MKKLLWVVVALILIVGAVFAWRLLNSSSESLPGSPVADAVTEYRCSAGKSITASFLSSGMKLELSDGREFMLAPAPAASGARYADGTGSVVFWAKQYSAFLEESGSTTFEGCLVHPLPFASDAR